MTPSRFLVLDASGIARHGALWHTRVVRLFGFPIRFHPFFFLTAVLMGIAPGREALSVVLWVLIATLSILWHELGHAFAGRAFGLRPEILLHGLGGLTSFAHGGASLTRGRDVVVSLAGPAAGLVAGGVVYAIGRAVDLSATDPLARIAYHDLLWVNVGWSIVNLLPVLPLDGGQVLAAFVRRPGAAQAISVATALGAGTFALVHGHYFGALLAAWLAVDNGRALLEERRRRGDQRRWPELRAAREALQRGEPQAAAELAGRVLAGARSAPVRAAAAEALAHARVAQDRYEDALAALDHLPTGHEPDPYLYAFLLLEVGLPERALVPARRAFDGEKSPLHGKLLLRALAEAAHFEEAASLLAREGAAFDAQDVQALEERAFRAGRFEVSASVGESLFRRTADPSVAYNVACALARLGRRDEALSWLLRAADAGFPDLSLLDSDEDLAGLRSAPEFGDARRRVAARAKA